MDSIFYLMIFALAILAVVDLVVGVSNDAVNFLNSAIGSKAIAFKKIMVIASLGVFVGAVFSSGMMEVARKGLKGKRMEPVFLAELAGSNLDGALIQRKRFRVL